MISNTLLFRMRDLENQVSNLKLVRELSRKNNPGACNTSSGGLKDNGPQLR